MAQRDRGEEGASQVKKQRAGGESVGRGASVYSWREVSGTKKVMVRGTGG